MKNQIQENVFLNHFDVSRETMSKLSQFSRILISQNQKVNIIGNSTTKNIWIRHFADSAKIFTILENLDKGCQKKRFLCDVGTGGGLPGFVLAILNQEKRLKIKFTLIDSNRKKFEFLNKVAKELDLDVHIINDRVENMKQKQDIITARAVAPLNKFFDYTRPIIKEDSVLILPKGKTWKKEANELKKKWRYDVNIVTNNKIIDNSGGVTLIFKEIKEKNEKDSFFNCKSKRRGRKNNHSS